MALVALVIAALAASLIAADLTLAERALREEAIRARLRVLLDGELASALARLDKLAPQREAWREWGEGEVAARRERVGGVDRYRVVVWARYAGREGVVEALVWRRLGAGLQVLSWRRLPAAERPAPPDP
jgi:hypothetical protein